MPSFPFEALFALTPVPGISPSSGRLFKLLAQKNEDEVNRGLSGGIEVFKVRAPQQVRPPHARELSPFAKAGE